MCIDIGTWITSRVAASDKVASMLNRDHVEHEADEKIAELTAVTERFLRV